ncbi:MAG: hypothetical protein F4Z96_06130 [Chloroflexi bacterium]|nr:hypothetical protein [Chloroflexota bacterium]
MTTDDRDDLPLLTLDLDGVICGPPFGGDRGLNLGISRRFLDPHERPHRAVVPPKWLSWPLDHLRFDFRRPLPGVAEALERLSEVRRLAVLTGRRSSPVHWLEWHKLDLYLDNAYWNITWLPSPHFKLGALSVLEAVEHIDDDGRTAQLMAERSEARPFLRDWPRNRDLPYHERVERVADLGALADVLVEEAAARG